MLRFSKHLLAVGAASMALLFGSVAAEAATLKVHNDTEETISYLYVSPTWAGDFRAVDQALDNYQYIRPGQEWLINFTGGGQCNFDLRAVFTDGQSIERDDADLCGDPTWTISE